MPKNAISSLLDAISKLKLVASKKGRRPDYHVHKRLENLEKCLRLEDSSARKAALTQHLSKSWDSILVCLVSPASDVEPPIRLQRVHQQEQRARQQEQRARQQEQRIYQLDKLMLQLCDVALFDDSDLHLFSEFLTKPEKIGTLLASDSIKRFSLLLKETPIDSAKILGLVLKHSTPDQCMAIYQALKYQIPVMVKTTDGLNSLSRYFPVQPYSNLLQDIRNDLSEALQDMKDENELNAFLDSIEDSIPKLIATAEDLRSILSERSRYIGVSDYRIALIDRLSNTVLRVVKSVDDVETIVHGRINYEHVRMIFNILTPSFFQSISRLSSLLERFDRSCFNYLLHEALEDFPNFHHLFQDIKQDFKDIDSLNIRPEVKQNIICLFFKSILQDIKQQARIDGIQDKKFNTHLETLEKVVKEYSAHVWSYSTLLKCRETDPFEDFAKSCVTELTAIQARVHKNSPILPLIGKWLLTLVTLGMTILVSSIRNKRETGRFQNRFFSSPLTEKTDSLKELVNAEFFRKKDTP